MVSRCSEIFSLIGIQVLRNIQPHWYPGAQKYSATLVSRCSEIFSHIGIQVLRNIQPHWYPGAQKYSATLVSRCAEIFSHIGIQVLKNMQPHWYRKHVKSHNLSTALLISSYQRCLAGGKIRKLSITLLRLQSFEGARLKAVVKTNAAWSRNQTHNMNTPYCRPRLKSTKGNGDTLISMKTSNQASSGLRWVSKTGPNCQLLCRARAKIAPSQLSAFLFDRWKIMIVAP